MCGVWKPECGVEAQNTDFSGFPFRTPRSELRTSSILGQVLRHLTLRVGVRPDVQVEVILVDVHDLDPLLLDVLRERVVALDRFGVVDDAFPVAVVQLGRPDQPPLKCTRQPLGATGGMPQRWLGTICVSNFIANARWRFGM